MWDSGNGLEDLLEDFYIYIYLEDLLGRLARKTCLGDLLGQNYPAYIYIYIYLGDLLGRLAWKFCSVDPIVCSTCF